MDQKHFHFISRVLSMILLLALLAGGALPALAAPGDITRVSVDSNGVQGNGYSKAPTVSANGHFVAYHSAAGNLVSGDTNNTEDVFVYDRTTGTTTRASADSNGAEANSYSSAVAISSDGHFVAFPSAASNLVSGDTNGFIDIFVHDMQTGATTRVSVDSSGAEANGDSDDYSLAISGDGRFVAFSSDATNLVSGDTNGATDVFVHDTQTGETSRVSVDSSGLEGDLGSSYPSISSDGRYVAFSSSATNLVSNDTNGVGDIFVRDRQTGQTVRASLSSTGEQAVKSSHDPAISGNGRYVAFSSEANNLAPGYEIWEHVYVRDLQTNTTTRASVYSDGNITVGWSTYPTISADGRFVAFAFDDRSDGAPYSGILLHDMQTGATLEVTGEQEYRPSLSADGRILAFESGSDRLVSGDTNNTSDIFVYEYADIPGDPSVLSITRAGTDPPPPTSADHVDFTVTFSETVYGVSSADYTVTTTGGTSGAFVEKSVTKGNTSTVTVNTGTGDGTVRLDLVDDDSIHDVANNPLGGPGAGNGSFTSGEIYTIDRSAPVVTGSLRADPNPTSADSVNFNVSFSEAVSGVDPTDFTLSTTGSLVEAAITSVNGSGNTYTVTASTGTGNGTLRLDVLDDDSILDASGLPLGGTGAGNGAFSTGETYTVDKTAPFVTGSLRVDPNPTIADIVNFNVGFSEAVSGVDLSDFYLSTTGGISGASISGVSGSGNLYTVTVVTGTGKGTLRLDIIDNDSILDALGNPLGGIGAGNGNFATGEVYTINKTPIVKVTETIRSAGANDGWVLESSENSNQGGSKNANGPVFALGDDNQNRQFRAILHFPTYYLPDNAVITRVLIMIRREGLVGDDPFGTHQNILVDVRDGAFGFIGPFPYRGLQISDFQSPASMESVGIIENNPLNGWYWAWLDSSSFQYINLTNITQFRLRFQVDDDNDLGNDYLRFYSGDNDALAFRPRLVVEYYVPR